MHGHQLGGSVLGGATFLSLVSAFIQRSKAQSRENIEKTRLLTGQDQEDADPSPWSTNSPKRAKKRKRQEASLGGITRRQKDQALAHVRLQ